jgi:hypothetical protein
MSVAQRNLSRLPLEVYGSVKKVEEDQETLSLTALRDDICSKLKAFSRKTYHKETAAAASNTEGITTVGDLLQLSPVALLHILDPILTYSEFKVI